MSQRLNHERGQVAQAETPVRFRHCCLALNDLKNQCRFALGRLMLDAFFQLPTRRSGFSLSHEQIFIGSTRRYMGSVCAQHQTD